MEENILGREKISKLFIKFSIPAIIAMLISGVQTIIDGIFLGNFVGSNAMASISMAGPYIQLVIGFSMLISVGSLSFMGRSLGEGNKKLTQDIFRTSTTILSVVALFLSIFGFIFSKNISLTLGANNILINDVSIYIKFISIFILPMSLAFLIGFADRLIEKPELYFKGMIVSLLFNITLNYLLIKKLQYGIAGAALATGISYSSVFFIVLSPMLNKNNVINLFVGKFNIKTIIPIVYNGSSEAIASIASAISAYLFNMSFIRIAGESGVTAFTSINYIAQFGTLIIFGIGDGIGSIISYNYGAKSFERVKRIFNLSAKIAFIIGFITFLILFLFGENLVTLFVASDKTVVDLVSQGAKLYALAFILNGFNTLCSAYFTAIGYAKESIIIALSRGLIFILLGITILPSMLGINGIWLTVPFAEVMTFAICSYLMNKYKLPQSQVHTAPLID
ncbi:MATE family efflux transporter [Clostridium tarantellae]|uniref:MATE family efflux transporter n=1 Tax=Clostridium tarantellae TaxID=39493 RepID=A0A6I1MQM1_9CLOT|nr:MATE family efflux transporter [Clostridium tarantellae]MPQ44457.1 MATE family efflux transporter [Clostridium tarantellae]